MSEESINISIKYGTENIDWLALCEIFRRAPLGTREPEKLKIAAENCHTVCSAYFDQKIIGFGRAISDSQYQSAIYDAVVLPEFQNQGVGKFIMEALLQRLPKSAPVLIFVAPGKQAFYRKVGFENLKTGMVYSQILKCPGQREFIIKGIRAGKIEYREGVMWGNPYLRILRSQLEKYVSEEFGQEKLAKEKSMTELRKTKREITKLKKMLKELEARKNELEKLVE